MYYMGVDVGGMSIKCGIITPEGVLLGKQSIVTPHNDYKDTIQAIGKLCLDTADKLGIDFADIVSVGVGIPGTVHQGIVTFATNLSWYKVPFADTLSGILSKPILAGNDANCAILAEYFFGKGKGVQNLAMVTLGTGIGTAFLIEGKLLLGHKSAGTEGGHMIIKSENKQCKCGLIDCWEVYGSTTALLLRTEEEAQSNPQGLIARLAKEQGLDGKTVFIAAAQGDMPAISILNNYINDVAIGLINITNLMRPEFILIGGGISKEEKALILPLQRIVNQKAYGGVHNPFIRIERAAFGNDAGIIGAACLAMCNE